jgi:hypothetical protein
VEDGQVDLVKPGLAGVLVEGGVQRGVGKAGHGHLVRQATKLCTCGPARNHSAASGHGIAD